VSLCRRMLYHGIGWFVGCSELADIFAYANPPLIYLSTTVYFNAQLQSNNQSNNLKLYNLLLLKLDINLFTCLYTLHKNTAVNLRSQMSNHICKYFLFLCFVFSLMFAIKLSEACSCF
jgi:VanZ family protein